MGVRVFIWRALYFHTNGHTSMRLPLNHIWILHCCQGTSGSNGGKSIVLRLASLNLFNHWKWWLDLRELGVRGWPPGREGRIGRGLRGICWFGKKCDLWRVGEGGVLMEERLTPEGRGMGGFDGKSLGAGGSKLFVRIFFKLPFSVF